MLIHPVISLWSDKAKGLDLEIKARIKDLEFES